MRRAVSVFARPVARSRPGLVRPAARHRLVVDLDLDDARHPLPDFGGRRALDGRADVEGAAEVHGY